MRDDGAEKAPLRVTDIEAAKENIENAVNAFTERWIPMPHFDIGVEVMDQRRLRDAMGLRTTFDVGDPWPEAERILYLQGFRWHWLGSQRVMFLQERDGWVPDTGWHEAEEVG